VLGREAPLGGIWGIDPPAGQRDYHARRLPALSERTRVAPRRCSGRP
jgi:hypothetical protein